MKDVGIESVYQLDGGILKYFEDVGGEHYTGNCFVFDQRTAVNPDLVPMQNCVCTRCAVEIKSRSQLDSSRAGVPLCKGCK